MPRRGKNGIASLAYDKTELNIFNASKRKQHSLRVRMQYMHM
jgi:hypothetical protein